MCMIKDLDKLCLDDFFDKSIATLQEVQFNIAVLGSILANLKSRVALISSDDME